MRANTMSPTRLEMQTRVIISETATEGALDTGTACCEQSITVWLLRRWGPGHKYWAVGYMLCLVL